VPLTPIQRRFFEQDLLEPHHYNRACCWKSRPAGPRAAGPGRGTRGAAPRRPPPAVHARRRRLAAVRRRRRGRRPRLLPGGPFDVAGGPAGAGDRGRLRPPAGEPGPGGGAPAAGGPLRPRGGPAGPSGADRPPTGGR
jgi:hypothetical protein